MTELSPAAKAVISKIADRDCIDRGEFYYRQVGAAALRAAVKYCTSDKATLLEISKELDGAYDN
jgi:hypothetical protein